MKFSLPYSQWCNTYTVHRTLFAIRRERNVRIHAHFSHRDKAVSHKNTFGFDFLFENQFETRDSTRAVYDVLKSCAFRGITGSPSCDTDRGTRQRKLRVSPRFRPFTYRYLLLKTVRKSNVLSPPLTLPCVS